MNTTDERGVTEILEELIDKHGLIHVITGIELVCDEKAEFIKYTWRDKALAAHWHKAAKLAQAYARKVAI